MSQELLSTNDVDYHFQTITAGKYIVGAKARFNYTEKMKNYIFFRRVAHISGLSHLLKISGPVEYWRLWSFMEETMYRVFKALFTMKSLNGDHE